MVGHPPSVCVVTPGYLASTPRVVKEADALHEAGYRVRVVFSEGDLDLLREHDRLLLGEKPWRWYAVRWSRRRPDERAVYWRATARHALARRVPASLCRWGALAERAEGRLYRDLAQAAAREHADLFIGHYPVGLAAAARAAWAQDARLGYDAEDLHTAEEVATPAGRASARRIDVIERKYLRRCAHVSAAAPRIADALAERYEIPRPVVVHNVFPWADRRAMDGRNLDRTGPGLSLCWFSQTIGLDRGVGDVIRAVGALSQPVQIHLRGSASDGVRGAILALARESGAGVAERVHLHPPVPPMELLSRIAEHDAGLALEQGHTANNALTVSNKLFVYLLAGLAVAATDVPGQRDVIATCPKAASLYPCGDWRALARALDRWQRCPERLRACRDAALSAARIRWNWERERGVLLESVARALAGAPAARPAEAQ
jgi:glycosyltransferase involved in cell wall biosynthesis